MESKILIARISDTVSLCRKASTFKFLGFLSLEEKIKTQRLLTSQNVKFCFFGGYTAAERVVLCCLPDWADEADFPIIPLSFSFKNTEKLTHRDFLGSFMALGITRETVGDILVEEGRAVAFVLKDVVDYIFNEIKKIGKTGVTVSYGFNEPLPMKNELAEFNVTVASSRLDCIVSALINSSRSEAVGKIELGLVSLNSVIEEKITKTVQNGDAVSVKGYGKFFIESMDKKTKKNRTLLKYKKYL